MLLPTLLQPEQLSYRTNMTMVTMGIDHPFKKGGKRKSISVTNDGSNNACEYVTCSYELEIIYSNNKY